MSEPPVHTATAPPAMLAGSSTAPYREASADTIARFGGHLGRYRIDDVIGVGGRGIVLAAHDPELARAIALKVLRCDDAVSQSELLVEGRAMAKLRHPNVVSVYDVGVADDRVFIAMELVAGVTLRAWQARPRPWRTVVETYLAAGRGLAAAHAAAVVHADFKPDNVLVGEDGSVRVADFGLTSVVRAHGTRRVVGSPAYMAPEQHDGSAIGPAADQFAFATALWEALAGARPFDGTGLAEIAAAKRRGPLAPPRRVAAGWVFALLRRCLAPDPARRHPSMVALVTAFERGLARRRRWVRGAGLLGTIAATAVAAAAFAGGDARPDCGLARAAIGRMWTARGRDAIAASFARTHRPHAAATAGRVIAEVDRRVTALAGAREASCTATYQRGEQSPDALDRQTGCLERQAGQLSALLDVFVAHADDEVVDHAYEAIVSLPDPESCAGVNQPLPAPGIRARVAALDQRRAGAEALRAAGHPEQARAALEVLAAEARSVGFPPLVAAVEHDRALATYHANDYAAAASAFQSAAEAAAVAGDDAMIADVWLGLLSASSDAGKPHDAFDRLGFVEVAVARAGSPKLREDLLFTRGQLEIDISMYRQAKADLEAARASLAARGQAHTLQDGRIEASLANAVWKLDDNVTALALEREALATFTAVLGPEHLTVAIVLNNLAMSLEEAGEFDEADRMLRRSLAIKERSFEPDNPSIAITLHNLGSVAASRGDQAAAIALTERALAIRERALGPRHPLVASSLSNLAASYREMGRPAEALVAAQRSLAIREERNGRDDRGLAFPLQIIAGALIDLGRAGEAEAPALRARAILEHALGADASWTGIAWRVIGDVSTALHRRGPACAAYDRAAAILENSRGADYQYLIDPLTGQAECALAAGDLARARSAADKVVAAVARNRAPAYRGGRARLVLAQILWATPATRGAARDEALQAVAGYAGAPAGTARERASARSWLATHRGP